MAKCLGTDGGFENNPRRSDLPQPSADGMAMGCRATVSFTQTVRRRTILCPVRDGVQAAERLRRDHRELPAKLAGSEVSWVSAGPVWCRISRGPGVRDSS